MPEEILKAAVEEPVEETEEPKVEPAQEEQEASELEEEVKEEQVKPDRPPENYKKEAEKWREKHHAQQEELKKLREDVDSIKQTPEKPDPETVEIGLDTFTEQQWDEIEERRGMTKEAIVEIHNTKARSNKKAKELESRLARIENSTSKKTVLDGVDESIRQQVAQQIDILGIDCNDVAKVSSVVELVKKSNTAAPATSGHQTDKKIIVQPEGGSSGKPAKTKVKLTETELRVAQKQGLTPEEYAANK